MIVPDGKGSRTNRPGSLSATATLRGWGAWGVTVGSSGSTPTFGAPARSATSYGVCFKCHSSYVALGGRPDLAREFDPANASLHSVEGNSTSTVPAGTFVGGWTSTSAMYCTDCHGDDGGGAQARDLHQSASAPILSKPYLGVAPDDPRLLCYSCHRRDVYATESADAGLSGFVTASGAEHLHVVHVGPPASSGHGLGCDACHVTHGSVTQPHLLRDDIGFTSTGAHAGSCTNACHDAGIGGGTRAYGS